MIRAQLRLIQNVQFPVSMLVAEAATGNRSYEVYDVLTGGVIEDIGPVAKTHTGMYSAAARVGDPITGRKVFLQAFAQNALGLQDLQIGTVVHAVGQRRQFNGAEQFRLIDFLEEAPLIVNGRYIETKQEVPAGEPVPAPVSDEDFGPSF